MNLFKKIGIAVVGMAMAVGVGVAVGVNNEEVKPAYATDVTITPDSTFTASGKSGGGSAVTYSTSPISINITSGYVNTGASPKVIQIYASSTTTISVSSGYYLTGITFTCSANNTSNYSASKLSTDTTNATWTCTSGQNTGVWAPKAGQQPTSVSFSATAQSKAKSIAISYASASPSVKIDGTSTEISVNVTESSTIDKTLTLTNVTMGALTIESDDTDVATFTNPSGTVLRIAGKSHGTADITIVLTSNSTLLFTIHVNVQYNNTVTVTSAGSATSLNEGATLQLTAVSSKGEDTFTWESSDDDIATVSASGLVTGVAVGEVTITATSVNWETSGEKALTINFAGTYSRGNWFDPATYDETAGTAATEDNLSSAITGSATTIHSIDVSGTVAFGKGGGLSFGKSSGAGSITIEMKTGFYLKSITIWGATWDAGITPTITATNSSDGANTTTLLSNGGSFVTKGTAMNDLPLTWTFASDAKTVTIATPGASKQRFIIYQLDLVFTTISASSVSLSDSSATLMQTETKQLTAYVTPRNYNVALSVTWTSSDETKATVSNAGLITASTSNTGSTTITASTTAGSPTCSVTVIKLAASSVNIRGDNADGLTSGTNQPLVLAGKTWTCTKVQKYALDYKGNGDTVLVLSKNGLRIGSGSDNGTITNDSTYSTFKFKKVIVAHCLNAAGTGPYAASFTVSGSDTKGNTDVASESSTSGLLTTYTLASAVSYVTVTSSGGTYISSLTFVFETPEETEFSAAEFILGLSPDRGEESINSCTLANGTYAAAKKFLYDAGSTVKANFQTSEDLNVVAARTRYTYWANNNHDISPYEGATSVLASRISDMNIINNTGSSTILVIVISLISVVAVGGYFFYRTRKEQ